MVVVAAVPCRCFRTRHVKMDLEKISCCQTECHMTLHKQRSSSMLQHQHYFNFNHQHNGYNQRHPPQSTTSTTMTTSIRQRQQWTASSRLRATLVCFISCFHLNLSLLTIFLGTNYSTNSHNERQATTTMEIEQPAMSQRAMAQNTLFDVFWAIGMFYILFSFKSFLTNYVFKY
jgi:hypothetical protein